MTETTKVQINTSARSMMEALNIAPERCAELCDAIETEWNKEKDAKFGDVLERAKRHCSKDNEANEFAFMVYIFGKHSGFIQAMEADAIIGSLMREVNRVVKDESSAGLN